MPRVIVEDHVNPMQPKIPFFDITVKNKAAMISIADAALVQFFSAEPEKYEDIKKFIVQHVMDETAHGTYFGSISVEVRR